MLTTPPAKPGLTQPDKSGLHILLKLACLVVILAGIHAAADILVQLLLALFSPSSLTLSSPGFCVAGLAARWPSPLWWW